MGKTSKERSEREKVEGSNGKGGGRLDGKEGGTKRKCWEGLMEGREGEVNELGENEGS